MLGLDEEELAKIRRGTRLEVERLGSCAGVAHLVLHGGRCALAVQAGRADISRGTRFTVNTICRLHGSTKSLVCAAFMGLVEDGRVKLDDPVAKHIKFSNRVADGTSGGSRPCRTTPTLRHLLTMTAGLRYTDCEAYARVVAGVRRGRISNLADFCDALAEVPLQFEPGTQHEYSFCTDVIGRVCEVVSGQRLEDFMRRRLLRPLGMHSTHFVVPPSQRRRCAVLYTCKPKGKSGRYAATPYVQRGRVPRIAAAGGGILTYQEAGLWGSARDYARFCLMLLSGGRALDGTQVLRPATVAACWRDGLAPLGGPDGRLPGWNVDDTEGPPWEGGSWDRCGFSPLSALLQGLPGAPRRASTGRRGRAMGLGGGGGTYWYVDAARDLVAISFNQSFNGGRPEDDGLGPPGTDCVDIAISAVDIARRKRRRTS